MKTPVRLCVHWSFLVTGNGVVIRRFLSGKKLHEVNASVTGSFDFFWIIDDLGISIEQNLEHGLGMNCRISVLAEYIQIFI